MLQQFMWPTLNMVLNLLKADWTAEPPSTTQPPRAGTVLPSSEKIKQYEDSKSGS